MSARDGPSRTDVRAANRRARALERLEAALAAQRPEPPPPVTAETLIRPLGPRPALPLEAYELARQVYYLQLGSFADAARAVIRAGLADTDDLTRIRDRLRWFWDRESWPRHDHRLLIAVRDASNDALYRGRHCLSKTVEGTPCRASALNDSDFCVGHDPRPKYVAKRARHAHRLWEWRGEELVPAQPFVRWLDVQRRMALAEARRTGEQLDPKDTGWSVLARKMGVNVGTLWRIARRPPRPGRRRNLVAVATVVAYAQRLGVSFAEIYGHDPPVSGQAHRCPGCGACKNPHSKLCRACYRHAEQGERCAYVNRRGERCPRHTRHPSGFCYHCRRIVYREPRPPVKGRVYSAVTPPMLAFALQEYERAPSLQWVAAKMWAHGVRGTYVSQRSLHSGLVKRFARAGVNNPDGAREMSERLLRELSDPVKWPPRIGPITDAGLVPTEPFSRWLKERVGGHGSQVRLAQRIGAHPETLWKWLHQPRPFVARAMVDRALDAFGQTFEEVYR